MVVNPDLLHFAGFGSGWIYSQKNILLIYCCRKCMDETVSKRKSDGEKPRNERSGNLKGIKENLRLEVERIHIKIKYRSRFRIKR
jgi:hypothetical protein